MSRAKQSTKSGFKFLDNGRNGEIISQQKILSIINNDGKLNGIIRRYWREYIKLPKLSKCGRKKVAWNRSSNISTTICYMT